MSCFKHTTGRVIAITDATGIQEFEYGNMGEVTTISRVIVAPNLPTRLFKTRFTYDSFNRIQYVTYPDGEQVNYYYNKGGNVIQMIGEQNHFDYKYIDRIDYDHYEQKTYIHYGNQTATHYHYTPELRRLQQLNVTASDGTSLFTNHYKYDKLGNILYLINTAGISGNNMLGEYNHNFSYDRLNRLIQARGFFKGSTSQLALGNDASADYFLEMSYTPTGGIQYKSQEHIKNGVTVTNNSYLKEYKYQQGTHRAIEIENSSSGATEHIDYDKNGNMVYHENGQVVKELFWDEANRLRVVSGNNGMQHYLYDGNNQRILKANTAMSAVYQNGTLSGATVAITGYTSYPSGYIVVNNADRYTKHYYLGSERIASRLGKENTSIFTVLEDVAVLNLKEQQQKDIFYYSKQAKREVKILPYKKASSLAKPSKEISVYFYHPDHLGTSTVLTNFYGKAHQFFLNLPFGETMAEQHSNSGNYTNSYKFNGKELDEETGFYYYGARYYNPRLSLWLSVDPLAESFPNWSPYNYTMQNPINYIDPDGRAAMPPTDYVDEEGNLLLRTNDGSNDVIIVKDEMLQSFTENIMSADSPGMNYIYDSEGWNETWKTKLVLGDNSEYAFSKIVQGYSSQWSRQKAINFLQNSQFGDLDLASWSEFIFAEVISQNLNPLNHLPNPNIRIKTFGTKTKIRIGDVPTIKPRVGEVSWNPWIQFNRETPTGTFTKKNFGGSRSDAAAAKRKAYYQWREVNSLYYD